MQISVTSGGKSLVESGIFNAELSSTNEVIIHFNYNKLKINLDFQVFIGSLPAGMTDFSANLEQGVVVLKQNITFTESQFTTWGYTGMLVPFEVGVKPDGKKIYLSWKADVGRSLGGALIAVIHYSFYEDE
ncbi:hypothetical protein [Klebsiella sp. BIGb0407]|uniref:hypothetical protein n=1 Tax=Klebsiella sp. BIGb0407 TaxID=2940603 RepID=UPI00216AA622|nr:hypothetical protein [Klebsiella sp. BIGb0407]MCS3430026.1 hypothetical protein [Klebsiella sp. BIGb0407]